MFLTRPLSNLPILPLLLHLSASVTGLAEDGCKRELITRLVLATARDLRPAPPDALVSAWPQPTRTTEDVLA